MPAGGERAEASPRKWERAARGQRCGLFDREICGGMPVARMAATGYPAVTVSICCCGQESPDSEPSVQQSLDTSSRMIRGARRSGPREDPGRAGPGAAPAILSGRGAVRVTCCQWLAQVHGGRHRGGPTSCAQTTDSLRTLCSKSSKTAPSSGTRVLTESAWCRPSHCDGRDRCRWSEP